VRLYIDVVGRCNLKCPSCPMGNASVADHVGGSMPPELLRRILEKAVGETKPEFVGLYNWTEPLLHPRIGELIEIVNGFGLPCYLSTNLNIAKRLDAVMKAAPYFLRISVSGFTNDTYRKHHEGGDIEVVKANMRTLAELRDKYRADTRIELFYLRWQGNLDEEFLMQEYAESLGFVFRTEWAWFSPIEKVLAVLSNDLTRVTMKDVATIERLARPFRETIQTTLKYAPMLGRCTFFDDYLVLDCAGRTALCCGVYDQERFTVGNYLDHPLAELMRLKAADPECSQTCRQCMGYGLPALGLDIPELGNVAIEHVLKRYAAKLGVSLVS